MIAFIDGDIIAPEANWIFRGRFPQRALPDEVQEYIERRVASLKTCVFQSDNIIAIQGPGNFRKALHPEYKQSASRLKSRGSREPWFENANKFIKTLPDVVESHGCEADDLLRMYAYEAEASGHEFAVISSDKDLDCIPGHHIDPKRGVNEYFVSEEQALHHYWCQILAGDNVDNIPGLERVGMQRASGLLNGASTSVQYLQAAIRAYQSYHGSDWEQHLVFNGRLIHMWRYPGDYFSI